MGEKKYKTDYKRNNQHSSRREKENIIKNNQRSFTDQLSDSKDVYNKDNKYPDYRNKKFHNSYDPDIELRQVRERFTRYKSGNWSDIGTAVDSEEVDLMKYREKQIRNKKPVDDIVSDTDVLARRQNDIDKGKMKPCYRDYIYVMSKQDRKSYQPRTPNKFKRMSRRAWDGAVRKWRKHIHFYKEENFQDLFNAGVTNTCCNSDTVSVSSVRSLSSLNSEHDDEAMSDRGDLSEHEEDTVKERVNRKRRINPVKLVEADDNKTVEASNNTVVTLTKEESTLGSVGFTSGLTNDLKFCAVSQSKRPKYQ